MVYITPKEIISRAEKKKVDLSEYTEEELEELIEGCQLFIEEQTGRIFEKRQITERFSRFSGTSLQLEYYPVLPGPQISVNGGPFVDSLKIDGRTVTWYLTEPEHGIILFDMPILSWGPYRGNNIVVQYTVCPFLDDPDKVHPVARKLVADMCLQELLKSPDGQELSSVKEGDLAESYTNVDWVDKQLDRLKRPIFATIP